MLLLILSAVFLTFLASILFLSLNHYETKKELRAQDIKSERNHIYSVGFNRSYTHDKKRYVLNILSILFVLFITWSIYGFTGNPEVKSYFFSELMEKDPKTLNKHEQLVRLQVLFLRLPHDGKLADALAVGYLEEGYFQDAVNIYLEALRLNGETAPRLLGYGLALIGYEGGIIMQEAQNVFQKAADLAPNDFYPRLLLAEALHQAGKSVQAVQFLQNFLETMPEDFKGRSRIEAMIIQLRAASD
ncbi:tetratricopeptide repeat protein [Bartonella senegalensis]|uniref:tetratricopeptide repeat protein n=1 Tax=Bartonella senegalensis TaxID=1468418 RepID=UPI0002FCCAC1|nr:tetratricopeptide repeat protein [Bartonella senegalensis]